MRLDTEVRHSEIPSRRWALPIPLIFVFIISWGCAVNRLPPTAQHDIHESETLFRIGQYKRALSATVAALDKTPDAKSRRSILGGLSRQAYDHYQNSRYAQAVDYYKTAARYFSSMAYKNDEITNLTNLARNQIIIGRYQQAKAALDRAVRLSETTDDKQLAAMTYVSLGYYFYQLRNYRQAIAHLDRAFELAKSENNIDIMGDALFLTGGNYRQQGDFEKGADYLLKALESYKQTSHRKMELGAVYRNLGELYLNRPDGRRDHNLSIAQDYLDRAIKIHNRHEDRLGYAMAVSHQGELYFRKKRFSKAMEEYQRAVSLFKETKFTDGLGRAQIHIGFTLGELKKYDAAVAAFDKALNIYSPLNDREWMRVALYGKGLMSERKGDKVSAERHYKSSIDLFESIRVEVAGEDSAKKLFSKVNSGVYENLIGILVERQDYQGALEYIERSRLKELQNYIFNAGVRNATLRNETNSFSTARKLETQNRVLKETMGRTKDPETLKVLVETLAENENQAKTVMMDLYREHRTEYAAMDLVTDTVDIRERMDYPSDIAALVYFATSERLYIFVVKSKNQVTVKSVHLSKDDLKSKVAATRRLIFAAPAPDTKAITHKRLNENLEELYDLLIAPVETEIGEDIATVAILPFSWLSYLPFEALKKRAGNGNASAYFIEMKNIVYLASQTARSHIKRLVKRLPSNEEYSSIVAFGNPDIGYSRMDQECSPQNSGTTKLVKRDSNPASNRLNPLPCAEAEVLNIGKLFPGSKIFIRENASKDNLESLWGTADIIHLAAHARLTPKGSELLLAPKKTGTVTMRDISLMNQKTNNQKTRFVALSACQTAVDTFLAGSPGDKNQTGSYESGVALTGAVQELLFLGIPTVIATLWPIADEGTYILMNHFYSDLKSRQQLYQSFREARIRMIRKNDRYSQPFYWAGFVFFGIPEGFQHTAAK